MTHFKQIARRIAPLALALALTVAMVALAGCDSSTPTAELPPAPTPVANPSPDNKLADITIDNEAANMDRLRKAGAAK